MAKQKSVADLSFEEASSELEALVATLESEQKSLEEFNGIVRTWTGSYQTLLRTCSKKQS